jgi:undecaprenyl-phosphate galactose phosphotransferase/putative colanic acid biosynthesis UDP-glucose lipid carrier transferase
MLKAVSDNLDFRTNRTERTRPNSVRGVLPYFLIEVLAIGSDAVLILTASVLTGILYNLLAFDRIGPVEEFIGIGFLNFVIFSAILAARAAYRPQNLANLWKQLRETTAVWLFVFFVLLAVAFLFKASETFSRGATLTYFVVGLAGIIIWRLVVARFLVHALAVGAFAERKAILLAEEGQLAGSTVLEEINRCGYTLQNSISVTRASMSSLKPVSDVLDISRRAPIECVFLLVSWDNPRLIDVLITQLRVLSIPIYLLPDRNVARFLNNRIVNIGNAWTAELTRAPLSAAEQACKRALDLLLASAALVILAPMMVLVSAWIKIETRGPIFFTQRRSGFNGRTFKIYKFRTMSVDEDGPSLRQATRNDPRVTNCGRLLRRTNIDELPQLLNVIAGDMSLVGPRPHPLALNSEYEDIIGSYAFRHHVKPGLTGWAQVNGARGETQTVELMTQRVEFDLWYINNWSLWLDCKILLRTLVLGLQPTAY